MHLLHARSFRTLLAAMLLSASAAAQSAAKVEQLFVLEDLRGDDHGTGALIYPNRDDMKPGELDLVSLAVESRPDGIWFVAEMGKNIRSPDGRVTELGQTPLERLARGGFYTFNIDIYIDTDRIAGAGFVEAMPGRRVTVDRNFAWEKAVILTPRPDIARTMLQIYFDKQFEAQVRADKGRVSKSDLAGVETRSEKRVDDYFFFPTKVRVAGRKVEFLVPVEFLGGVPSKSWGYTVIVTGADVEQAGSPYALVADTSPMMTMGVARGLTGNQWGIRGDVDPGVPPVVDVVSMDRDLQATVLYNYDTVSGRLAAVPGVAPDGNVAVSPEGRPLTMEEAARVDTAAAGEDGAAVKATATEKRTVPARLRTLNQLLADGLITQSEYDELRRKILAEL
jgi:hypothetical protein